MSNLILRYNYYVIRRMTCVCDSVIREHSPTSESLGIWVFSTPVPCSLEYILRKCTFSDFRKVLLCRCSLSRLNIHTLKNSLKKSLEIRGYPSITMTYWKEVGITFGLFSVTSNTCAPRIRESRRDKLILMHFVLGCQNVRGGGTQSWWLW